MFSKSRLHRSDTFDLTALGLYLSGITVIAAYVFVLQMAAERADYNVWGGLVFIPILVLATIPLLKFAGRIDPDPRFLRLLATAFAFKAVATGVRLFTTMVFYDGNADASGYDGHGVRLAESYRHGDFSADVGRELVGTGFIRALTGVVYAVAGPSLYVGYAVFAWLGFWGLYFFYRAFQSAIPDGDHRRYALLVFFLPSMVFWPSGIGKEACMTFGIGLTAFGAARLLGRAPGWLLPLAAGLCTTWLVRPHIAAMLVTAVTAAIVLRRSLRQTSLLTPLKSGIVTLSAIGITVLLATGAAAFLKVEGLSGEGLKSAAGITEGATSQGGSEFSAVAMSSPLEFPWAFVTVLFRPFPIEVQSGQMVIAAVEAMAVAVLAILSIPRLRGIGGRLRREPYLIFCLVYVSLFVYAFSYVGNFGILARQRVQVLPFALVFLALPLLRRCEEQVVRASPPSVSEEAIA